jgi:sulfatase maturation enzyme AslB (radical SAM superfamily)
MPEYEYFFQALKQRGFAANINLQIITNATNVNRKFYDLLGCFKSVRLSVSVDAYGKANDYIRWPSKFDQITKNIKAISNLPHNVQVDILNSLNILSMFDYHKFLSWCGDMESLYESKKRIIRVVPMKVQYPKEYSPFSAPSSLKQKFSDDVKGFIDKNNLTHNSNWKLEMSLLLRSVVDSSVDSDAVTRLKHKIDQLDRQRNQKVTNYIPDFYKYI